MKTSQPVAADDCQDTENHHAHRRAGGTNKPSHTEGSEQAEFKLTDGRRFKLSCPTSH